MLPDALLNFCCAPMPFVIGVLSHQLPELLSPRMRDAMEQVVVFDVDRNEFLADSAITADVGQLPQPYKHAMMQSLDRLREIPTSATAKMGKRLARPFLAFFVQVAVVLASMEHGFIASNVFLAFASHRSSGTIAAFSAQATLMMARLWSLNTRRLCGASSVNFLQRSASRSL